MRAHSYGFSFGGGRVQQTHGHISTGGAAQGHQRQIVMATLGLTVAACLIAVLELVLFGWKLAVPCQRRLVFWLLSDAIVSLTVVLLNVSVASRMFFFEGDDSTERTEVQEREGGTIVAGYSERARTTNQCDVWLLQCQLCTAILSMVFLALGWFLSLSQTPAGCDDALSCWVNAVVAMKTFLVFLVCCGPCFLCAFLGMGSSGYELA